VKFRFELVDEAGVSLMTLTVNPMFGRRSAGSEARA
jgi:hypothetical protein